MTLNRVFLILLAVLGATWVLALAFDLRHQREDREFQARAIQPYLKSPDTVLRSGALDQWFERMQRRNDNSRFRENLFFAAIGLTFVWASAAMIRNERFWRKRNAPSRSADAWAGEAIREVQRVEGSLTARTSREGWHFLPQPNLEVEVSFTQRTVTFRGFTFGTLFIGNKARAELTLAFGDLLGGRIWVNHGRQALVLHTTAGSTVIPESVQPFSPLVAVLLDAAEVNRKDPAGFAAALAREPRIKTPWYGWLISAAALAGVGGLAVWLWNMLTRR